MKTAVHLAGNACVALLALVVIGCMTWNPGWKQTPHPGSGSDVSGLLENAEALGRTADDRPSLQASIDDLEWVVAQDLETAGGVYAWKVYFQRDARQLLTNVDRYF